MNTRARLHLQNATLMIEWPDTPAGLMQAKAFRKRDARFARRRIRHVLQAFPIRVPCGEVLELTFDGHHEQIPV